MKNILVCEQNLHEIGKALASINGTAYRHTFSAANILSLALSAEKKGMALVGNKKILMGCRYVATSGQNLPKAYKYSRVVNCVTLCRKATGWILIDLKRESLGIRIPAPAMHLTRKAADKAIKEFQKKFLLVEE